MSAHRSATARGPEKWSAIGCPSPLRSLRLTIDLGSQVFRSASQRSADRLGPKQYSPPRVTTKLGKPCRRRRIGRSGMVNVPVPSPAPTSGSFSVDAPMKMPSLTHWF